MSVELDLKAIFDTTLESPATHLCPYLSINEEKRGFKDLSKQDVEFVKVQSANDRFYIFYYYVRPDGHYVMVMDRSTNLIYSYYKVNTKNLQGDHPDDDQDDHDDHKDHDDDDDDDDFMFSKGPILPNMSHSGPILPKS